jgi:hypothetical protein
MKKQIVRSWDMSTSLKYLPSLKFWGQKRGYVQGKEDI